MLQEDMATFFIKAVSRAIYLALITSYTMFDKTLKALKNQPNGSSPPYSNECKD